RCRGPCRHRRRVDPQRLGLSGRIWEVGQGARAASGCAWAGRSLWVVPRRCHRPASPSGHA
ncbi:hypothetical protein, partial [Escherichia coli]|uniref:hypothetical protein n=1 Tax=Escherichia coli TaxID=562 RepID=UPI001BDB9165